MRSLRSSLYAGALLIAGAFGCADTSTPVFSGDSAYQFLLKQCEFGPRVPASTEHANTVRYLVQTMQAQNATVQLQNFSIQDPYEDRVLPLTNIIGSYFPDRSKRILLAAHFDCRPRADQETVDSLKALPILGANDSASGVAVLLEVGRLLAEVPPDDIGVDIVFFDGEDYGKEGDLGYYLLGSKYFAANLDGYRPVCGVLLDLVGGTDCKIRQEGNSLQAAPRLVDDLFSRAARLGLDVFLPERFSPVIDDHVPLLRAGIPMVDLIGLPYEHWHKLSDTPENCSPETLRQVGMLVTDFVYDFTFE
jgi:hypothetical protein